MKEEKKEPEVSEPIVLLRRQQAGTRAVWMILIHLWSPLSQPKPQPWSSFSQHHRPVSLCQPLSTHGRGAGGQEHIDDSPQDVARIKARPATWQSTQPSSALANERSRSIPISPLEVTPVCSEEIQN